MSQHKSDVDALDPITDLRDQTVFVAPYVEDYTIAHHVRRSKIVADIGEIVPIGLHRHAIPVAQGLFRIPVLLPELSKPPLGYYSHRIHPMPLLSQNEM